MNLFFKGFHKNIKGNKEGLGVCSFSIPEYGLLHRSIVLDKDEVLLDFMSLLLLFDFIILNSLIFKEVNFLNICGPKKILQYIISDNKIPKKVEVFKNASNAYISKIKQDTKMQIAFLEVSEKENPTLLNSAFLKIDKDLVTHLKLLSEVNNNDTRKGW